MKRLSILIGLSVGIIVSVMFAEHIAVEPALRYTDQATQDKKIPKISGIVVPHHNIVQERRVAMFSEIKDRLSDNPPSSIILISPNHYDRGRGLIQTTEREWRTADGMLAPNKSAINALVETNIVTREPDSFAGEHGITLILGDIKQTFPDATLVPLIIKESTGASTIQNLKKILNAQCNHCLVIASVDFSHYQPSALADLHDRLTLRGLQMRNSALLMQKAETDAPPVLGFLTQWAGEHETPRFVLFDHTNSGVMLNNPDSESTSHIFGWYEEGIPEKPAQGVTFAFAGDMMFGRAVLAVYEKKKLTSLFDHFGNRVFWGVDAAIANLEGPISATRVVHDATPNNLSFLFSPKTIDALTFLKLAGVSLANNHTLNNGGAGLKTTRSLLESADIVPIGDPQKASQDTVGVFEGEGIRLFVVGVHAFAGTDRVPALIQELKRESTDRVIIFPHWGLEYQTKHSSAQEKLARTWIDAGADAIIGAHPHVIQDIGAYRGKPIVYSLGNFIFDQTFSKKTQTGLIVAGEFTPQGLSLILLPHESKHYQPRLLAGAEKNIILNRITAPVKEFVTKTDTGTLLFFPNK